MTQWFENDQLDVLQLEISALDQKLDSIIQSSLHQLDNLIMK